MEDIRLIVNRIRMDMVRRGDMMSVDDVADILAVPVIGAVPDDEDIVISANQGEPLADQTLWRGRLISTSAGEFPGNLFRLWIWIPIKEFWSAFPAF